MLIDTHAHLTDERLMGRIGEVLARAREAGVTKIIAPSTSLEDARSVVEMVSKYDEIYGLVGIHPESVDLYRFPIESGMTAISELTGLIKSSKKIVGIGEIGLDFFYDKEKRGQGIQMRIFQEQLELAIKLHLPVAIHMRTAETEMTQIISQMKKLPRGQFHCWAGSEELLNLVLEKGFYVSFCGNITYPSAGSGQLRDLIKKVPLDRLLLETDSPYLAPKGHRGSFNEPMNVRILAEYIANLLGLPLETLINQTTRNGLCLYFGG